MIPGFRVILFSFWFISLVNSFHLRAIPNNYRHHSSTNNIHHKTCHPYEYPNHINDCLRNPFVVGKPSKITRTRMTTIRQQQQRNQNMEVETQPCLLPTSSSSRRITSRGGRSLNKWETTMKRTTRRFYRRWNIDEGKDENDDASTTTTTTMDINEKKGVRIHPQSPLFVSEQIDDVIQQQQPLLTYYSHSNKLQEGKERNILSSSYRKAFQKLRSKWIRLRRSTSNTHSQIQETPPVRQSDFFFIQEMNGKGKDLVITTPTNNTENHSLLSLVTKHQHEQSIKQQQQQRKSRRQVETVSFEVGTGSDGVVVDSENLKMKKKNHSNRKLITVTTVQELHEAVLDNQVPFKNVQIQLDIGGNESVNDAVMSSTSQHHQQPTTTNSGSRSTTIRKETTAPSSNHHNAQTMNTLDSTNVLPVFEHPVVQLIVDRYRTKSTPQHRRSTNDTTILALSLEGGGMRGAVTAGMAAAIASLGLLDSFDRIYGSSAGSVIGAYMVSRQMCMDVYVDILPASKRLFVCTKRMVSSLAKTALDMMLWNTPIFKSTTTTTTSSLSPLFDLIEHPQWASRSLPGMNISFVLEGIMHHEHGLRPLDLDRFYANDRLQPLRVASSYVIDGKLKTRCFGTEDFPMFYNNDKNNTRHSTVSSTGVRRVDGMRAGLYACLEASMTVPGATGPPVRLIDPKIDPNGSRNVNTSSTGIPYFDAFCFEPLPYRSAVDEGATHVFVLCSRPEGFQPKSQPGVYERAIAPLYFQSHGEPAVANFFEQGGQQYIYAEDLLVLQEGQRHGLEMDHDNDDDDDEGVSVPPPKILFGVDRDETTERLAKNRHLWKKAHLLPLKVPLGTPELPTLEQDRDAVLAAVRSGYAAAFDLLAPAIGIDWGENKRMTGIEVANFVFPSESLYGDRVLEEQIRVAGDEMIQSTLTTSTTTTQDLAKPVPHHHRVVQKTQPQQQQTEEELFGGSASHLLGILPGFANGQMAHLATNLRQKS